MATISGETLLRRLLLAAAAALLLLLATPAAADSDSDRAAELLALQSRSKSGVIHLDDHSISRFLTSTKPPRSYSLLVFFDATQLHDKSELHLPELRREFSLLAAAFAANNAGDPASRSKLFFCDLEFKESQSSFAQFGVNSLPHIRLVGPEVRSLKDSEQMDQGDFSRMAESMSEFVESRTRLRVGPIARPPMLSKMQITIVCALILIWLPFAAKKVFAGETLLHDKRVWLVGAVFVYFFSVAGTMHNIIRKMPMFLVDRNDPSKLVFFYQGSGMQLGAEGFAVGFLYTIVGLLMALMTHLLVRVRNLNVQRLIMGSALLVCFWAVKKVVYLDNWKTGYGIHGFWPSGWN
ncbi:probable dolichyl-diphosphooligosaccharide--protein glycosyltransferase subunit 3B [Syzygium oleosum]|uniref:probable dolichyl-diphosphooligosaccharide--protein glycosyltransferase subunit 3B n=1 Tax=Syzygium oleosum TaxID=219896 RepID=UPI0011D26AAE|nr:probable dolichyl-diphosphooligosaccharide--protein glycosyltransferase subunit 3B [Syzygium oleosum]